jgi:hypothetical protein
MMLFPFEQRANIMRIQILIAAALLTLMVADANAGPSSVSLPMHQQGAATYYVQGQIEGYGATDLMVDTGSGYMTINERILEKLQAQGMAHYLRKLQGVMAGGQIQTVPIYEIAAIRIGDDCVIHNIEAAVFPGSTRPILGLSVLKRVAPFEFSLGPALLTLHGCGGGAI